MNLEKLQERKAYIFLLKHKTNKQKSLSDFFKYTFHTCMHVTFKSRCIFRKSGSKPMKTDGPGDAVCQNASVTVY